jgi:hypothetical protein
MSLILPLGLHNCFNICNRAESFGGVAHLGGNVRKSCLCLTPLGGKMGCAPWGKRAHWFSELNPLGGKMGYASWGKRAHWFSVLNPARRENGLRILGETRVFGSLCLTPLGGKMGCASWGKREKKLSVLNPARRNKEDRVKPRATGIWDSGYSASEDLMEFQNYRGEMMMRREGPTPRRVWASKNKGVGL